MARILICLDSFKGSISSPEAGHAISRGWSSVAPEDVLEVLAFADGGEGTNDAIQAALAESKRTRRPLPGGQELTFLLMPDGSALVELAELCGLRVQGTNDPLGATTLKVGQAIKMAVDSGSKHIYVALGGSASTDGGAGLFEGLGAKLLDSFGNEIEGGNRGLANLSSANLSHLGFLSGVNITVLSDVENPLLGDYGAVRVFGPQKGASPLQLEEMERNLRTWANFFPNVSPSSPGAGAAGGTAFGLMVLGAAIKSGGEFVSKIINLDKKIISADVVITGEGMFDLQSLDGKAVSIVLDSCQKNQTPCYLVAGQIVGGTENFKESVSLTDLAPSQEISILDPTPWLQNAGASLASAFHNL